MERFTGLPFDAVERIPRGGLTSEETFDPMPGAAKAREATAQVVVELLYHPDLRRIGDVAVLGELGDPRAEQELVLGRDHPGFARGEGDARPLGDPCVSRSQLIVQYLPRERMFRVSPTAEARRELTLYGPDGAPLARSAGLVAQGGLVGIGDRVLLALDVRPRESSRASMGLVGQSAALRAVRDKIRALADVNDVVLVRGETGVGKELVAKALHDHGKRRQGPWVPLNCAAIPEALVESELFGHVKGAFTGAVSNKAGLFQAAAGGTIFLDEIGELPMPVQAKLLRVLELGSVRPVGATHEVETRARVVCATNRDLKAEVRDGRFRADLLSRIAGLDLVVPPLARRMSDVPALFAHFLLAHVDGDTSLAWLVRAPDRYPPPVPFELVRGLLARRFAGNARELGRLAAEVAVRNRAGAPFRGPDIDEPAVDEPTADDSVARPDRAGLLRALEANDFVAQRAAKALGVPRSTLHRWMRDADVRQPKDITDDELAAVEARTGGDLDAMAAALRVSARGLKLRLGSR